MTASDIPVEYREAEESHLVLPFQSGAELEDNEEYEDDEADQTAELSEADQTALLYEMSDDSYFENYDIDMEINDMDTSSEHSEETTIPEEMLEELNKSEHGEDENVPYRYRDLDLDIEYEYGGTVQGSVHVEVEENAAPVGENGDEETRTVEEMLEEIYHLEHEDEYVQHRYRDRNLDIEYEYGGTVQRSVHVEVEENATPAGESDDGETMTEDEILELLEFGDGRPENFRRRYG